MKVEDLHMICNGRGGAIGKYYLRPTMVVRVFNLGEIKAR